MESEMNLYCFFFTAGEYLTIFFCTPPPHSLSHIHPHMPLTQPSHIISYQMAWFCQCIHVQAWPYLNCELLKGKDSSSSLCLNSPQRDSRNKWPLNIVLAQWFITMGQKSNSTAVLLNHFGVMNPFRESNECCGPTPRPKAQQSKITIYSTPLLPPGIRLPELQPLK